MVMSSPILAATLFGSSAHLIQVQARSGRGLSRVILVGMPDAVAREARERLPEAFAFCGYSFPKGKVLFNLVPAQLPKGGLPMDLALAVALLVQEGQWPAPARPLLFLAELDLQGRLLPPSRGTLLAALAAAESNHLEIVTAASSAAEAAIAPGVQAYGLADLTEVEAFLRQPRSFHPVRPRGQASKQEPGPRLDDLRGQSRARQAAILSVAGRHPLLLQGPPGTGKSMLARRMIPLLPKLDPPRALELAQVEALLGPVPALPEIAPFRAPHTSASAQAVLGGGQPLRPGEVARAHGGILFLDELPEFSRPVLEGLRQPLEEKEVRLQRAKDWARYPADCLLVATSNPCACGFATHPRIPCRCTPHRLAQYRNRISGPLQDRFDLFVEMGPVTAEELEGPSTAPHDETVRKDLDACMSFQAEQAKGRGFGTSAQAEMKAIQAAGIEPIAATLLRQAADVLPLSGRGVLRCLRVARTAADLHQRVRIRAQDMRVALSYRPIPVEAEATTGPPHSRPPSARRPPPPDAAPVPHGSG